METLYLQSFTEIIETNAKNGVVPLATSNVKLFLETRWSVGQVEDNIIIYIYIYI